MKCLLCLVSDQDETKCIQVDSLQWLDLNIKKLIDKYLWCIFQAQITSEDFVCSSCWEELNDFHKFYTRIENAHNGSEFKVKTEIDALEEASNTSAENDFHKFYTRIENAHNGTEFRVKIEIDPLEDDSNTSEENPMKLEKSLDMSLTRTENTHNGAEFKVKTEIDSLEKDSNAVYEQSSDMFVMIKQENEDNDDRDMNNDNDLEIPVDVHYYIDEISDGTTSFSTDGNESELSENDTFLKEHFQIMCNKCQLPFNRFSLLCQHYRIEHYEQGFVTCCQMKFFRIHLLVDHINWHLNPEYFKCSYCDKLFTTRRCLMTHTKSHENGKHRCNACDEKFDHKYMLDRHKLKHLPDSEEKFSCNECGKLYDNQYILIQHQRTVHQAMTICDICGQTFSGSSSLKHHMKIHAPTVRRVKCDVCGLLLSSQTRLKRHRDQEHSVGGRRVYECPICMKISPSPRALKDHVQKMHEMSFKCTVCKKEFERLDHFQSHMARHTGTPLYHCPLCPKQCYSSAYMNKHRKLKHPIEWEEAQRQKNSGNSPPTLKPSTK